MNAENLNRWLTLVANFAVIAGILFLAIEIRQNTQQLEIQSYQAWRAANTEMNMAIADPELSAIVAAGHDDSTKLTKDTYIAYAMFHLSLMQMAQETHFLYQQGSLDKELWQAEMYRAAEILSLAGVRQWWEAGGRTQLTPSFVAYIEDLDPEGVVRWSWDEDRGYFPDPRSE